ncbi:hypothetical protein [Evansella cellulosilytica]|uniref:Uncharacterized protein n=1 Tax=Evansella cellulosilytica (strain ATCC 21833 / DSM 2522 / FERM P-1141 / JCM 9156 / N-4) TaxID=649639 RepID=E6TR61_EVAC2|nr:hypothetical protein [Evansella cellulosilytica]ADU30573.1 hypothetical protein Bcell_2313 [Evansella cellulosilytica DSM 2522]
MNTQTEVVIKGKKLLLTGVIATLLTVIATFTFSFLLHPLTMLQIRLCIIGLGVMYCIAVVYYIYRMLDKLEENKNNEGNKNKDVIIIFNGKQLGK